MEMVTTIYLWTYRISILILFWLTLIDLRRNKTKVQSSIVVFVGVSIILSAMLMDIIVWFFFMRKFLSIYIFEKAHVISMLLTSMGYIISVYGCFKKLSSNGIKNRTS